MKRFWHGLCFSLGMVASWTPAVPAQEAKNTEPPAARVVADSQPPLSTEGCCAPASAWKVVGGGGINLVQPLFQSNPAFRVNGVTHDFTQNLDGAPQAWIGVQRDDGWGFRTRYFQYAQGSQADIVNPGGGTVINTANPLGLGVTSTLANERTSTFSDLNVLTWDFEFTKHLCCGQWTLDLAAGARYAHLSQGYEAYVGLVAAVPKPLAFDLDYGNNFNGAGPTFALDLHRQIGDTSLSLYCNTRLSILFGTVKQSGELEISQGGVVIATIDRSNTFSEVIPVGELEAGLECVRNWGGFSTLLQVGFIGQIWWGAGNASSNNSSLAIDNHSNFGFVGLSLRAGFQY